MRTNRTAFATALLVTILSVGFAASRSSAASADAAIRAAAKKHRYVFVTFYKGNDGATRSMLATMKSVQGKLGGRADFLSVDASDKSNRAVVSRYGADRSPMPLTIAIAPNGAVTAGYPKQIRNGDVSNAFVSDGTAAVLKVIQGGKLAAVCVQNSRTKHNKESFAAAQGLRYDPQFRGAVEVLKIDPADRDEAQFMKQCQLSPSTADAQIVVIAPPGKMVGKFGGATTTASITASLVKTLGGGCSGGCAGGCGGK